MSQWGSSDAASNSVIWAPTSVKLAPTRTNANTLYGNTTADAFVAGQTVGMFAVDSTEEAVAAGGIASIVLTSAGSGYTGNTTVTISGGGGSSGAANAEANATGRIEIVNISNAGSSYENNPTVTIAAPTAITFNADGDLTHDAGFNALSGVANTTEFITTSTAHTLSNGDRVQYLVAAGNTAVGGLTNAASYYVVSANSTALKVANTSGGSALNITASVNETGHTLRRLDFIDITSNVLQNGDQVTYKTAAGNTVIVGLANNTSYYVVGANATGVYLSTANNGSRIALTPGANESGHSLTGQTATAVAVVGGAKNKGIPHTGWVLRTEGTGGRAGRVQYEVLVAGGIVSDGSDDTILPDA
jgi:hypothetical protein